MCIRDRTITPDASVLTHDIALNNELVEILRRSLHVIAPVLSAQGISTQEDLQQLLASNPTESLATALESAQGRSLLADISGVVAAASSADATTLGSVVESARAVESAPVPTLQFSASNLSVPPGEPAQLTWSATNALQCTATGGWTGSRETTGAENSTPIEQAQTFTLTCVGLGGAVSADVVVQLGQIQVPPPVISLTTSAQSVVAGERVALTWSATNAESCEAAGSWSGTLSTSGTQTSAPIDTASTFELTCAGQGGNTTVSTLVVVTTPEAPQLSFSASVQSVPYAGQTELSWTAENAQSCVAAGSWQGNKPLSGSEIISGIVSQQSFQLTCTNTSGAVNVTVNTTVLPPPTPSLAFSASSTSIERGDDVTLAWTSQNTTGCEASGDWSGNRAVTNTQVIAGLTENSSFGLTCTGPGGDVSRTVDVEVLAIPVPTLTFTTNLAEVVSGQVATLSWSATNATSCTASGAWSGTRLTSGSAPTGPLTTSSTFSLSCTGRGGVASRTVDVEVAAIPAPALTFNTNLAEVDFGEAATLSWSATNATSCTASGAWSGTRSTSGSAPTGSLTASSTFVLNCSGPGGVVSRTVNIAVSAAPAPALTFATNLTVVEFGESATLSWSTANVTSCNASGAWSGTRSTSGSAPTGSLTTSSTYVLNCSGPGGVVSRTVNIQVSAAPVPTLTFTTNPAELDSGEAATLSWSATNATSCNASGAWSGTRPISGSATTGPLTASSTFTLSCTGPGGVAQRSAEITVVAPVPLSLSLNAEDNWIARAGATNLEWISTGANNCEASDGWSGSRNLSGTESTGTLFTDTFYTLVCNGAEGSAIAMTEVFIRQALISWSVPTQNTDGSPLTDLTSFRLYYGQASGNYTSTVEISDPTATSYVLELQPGTYYFSLTAFNAAGEQSDFSTEQIKVIE